jgi:oligopeptide transport system substrate-binding protein
MNRMLAIAGSLLIALTAVAGCSRDSADADGGLKVYRHSEDGAPTSIDPLQAGTVYANMVVLNVYDTLYRYKYLARPYELVPNLAVDMPEVSEDGRIYTIELKKGVRFIDDAAFENGRGREVTAHDFVYSMKRHFDPENVSQGAWVWEGRIVGLRDWVNDGADYDAEISGLRALDDHTLQIQLKQPFPQFIHTLAMGFSSLVPREAAETYGRDLGTRAVGSGPFRLSRYARERVVFERNPGFRAEPLDLEEEGFDASQHGHLGIEHLDGQSPPFVDRLEIDFIAESSARWASFTSGREIQYTSLPVEQTDAVLASKTPVRLRENFAARYHLGTGPEGGLVFYMFNMKNPEIGYNPDPQREARNRELRCAMRDAFDWQARNERFYSGLGRIFPGVITPILPEFDPDMSRDSVTQNQERARERLKAAGWTADNIPELDYGFVSAVISREMYEEFRGSMSAVGIPGERIRPRSFATFGDYNRALRQSELAIMGYGWSLSYPDAQYVFQLFYGPNAAPGANAANYRNAEFDRLYNESATMEESPERTEIYRRMNQVVIDDCVAIMGLSRARVNLWHKRVRGLPDREVLGGFWLRFVDVKD